MSIRLSAQIHDVNPNFKAQIKSRHVQNASKSYLDFLLYDLKQLEKLEKTGEDKKTLYIGGEYPRQLNVIDFWGIFNWRRSRVNWRRIVYP